MSDVATIAVVDSQGALRSYRAITRHTDGRIIHVRDIQAGSDAEAIRIVTARGADIRTDLYGENGLIQRFGVPNVEPVTPRHGETPD